ncbi:MAG: hypothetical protein M1588_02110, partial [Planctomycetes bacterium]|nr:hypothetical protein [Planctomycetota bacterium]
GHPPTEKLPRPGRRTIIMAGGASASRFAQLSYLSAAEYKTLLVAGAAAGMTATPWARPSPALFSSLN